MTNEIKLGSSFRDPSGYVFIREDLLYRRVNRSYQAPYDKLISTGLYENLVKSQALIPHEEVKTFTDGGDGYKTIQPEKVQFISYPYEWSFSQLKDAALLTLRIALKALNYGMVLKDASAYNVQFHEGRPVFIDTLSFDLYVENKPWEAYRQFCQHFLAPLALASLLDIRLVQLLKVYIDGIPLDLASKLLPWKTRLDIFGLGVTIHTHARMQRKFSASSANLNLESQVAISKVQQQTILKGLMNSVESLKWQPKGTEWGNYYSATNYSDEALRQKGEIVASFIEQVQPKKIWDLGANTGLFSREGVKRNIFTVAFDIDPAAVEINYQIQKKQREIRMLPLLMDLSNPSPDLGWSNSERDSLVNRGPADLVMALALVHHLAISNNVPLEKIAQFFACLGHWAIMEFVPKEDSQVQKLLKNRKDIFENYNELSFEMAFQNYYSMVEKKKIQGSSRLLYLFKKSQ